MGGGTTRAELQRRVNQVCSSATPCQHTPSKPFMSSRKRLPADAGSSPEGGGGFTTGDRRGGGGGDTGRAGGETPSPALRRFTTCCRGPPSPPPASAPASWSE